MGVIGEVGGRLWFCYLSIGIADRIVVHLITGAGLILVDGNCPVQSLLSLLSLMFLAPQAKTVAVPLSQLYTLHQYLCYQKPHK